MVKARGATPYLVLSPVESNASQPTVTMAPFTSAPHSSRFQVPCRFEKSEGRVVLDEMIDVRIDELERRVGELDPESAADVRESMRQLFGE